MGQSCGGGAKVQPEETAPPHEQVVLLSMKKEQEVHQPPPRQSACTPFKFCCGCGCCIIFLLGLLYLALLKYFSDLAVQRLIDLVPQKVGEFCSGHRSLENLTVANWWPGCGYLDNLSSPTNVDTCASPCFSGDLLRNMSAFNAKNPGGIVTYTSASEDGVDIATLSGWWAPAPRNPETAPRIVIQHGFQENSNKFRVQLAAYMLRSIGFSVLINNFRDHCYSGPSKRPDTYQWGDGYPLDTLGAWQYAKADPQGLLGGALDDSKVGIMGFSKGAFTALSALGLGPTVPAVWADAPPMSPRTMFSFGAQRELQSMGLGFLFNLLDGPAWYIVQRTALDRGVNLTRHLPLNVLPRGPDTKRPVFWTGNQNDTTVPISEGEVLADFMKGQTKKYNFSTWTTSDLCNGENHCVDHLSDFEAYRDKLCKFWTSAFDLTEDFCKEGQGKKASVAAAHKVDGRK